MNFELNLSLIIAHTLVYEQRLLSPKDFDPKNGGDPTYTTGETMDSILGAYVKHFPELVNVTSAGMLPLEQAKVNTAQVTAPQYDALQTLLYGTYGPQLAQIGSNINKQTALNQALSDTAVVSGPGRQLVQEALKSQQLADPEYYANRALAGNQLSSLLNSINMSGLTPMEREETQRAVNQQNVNRGNLTNPAQMTTVENAMSFGDELNKKRNTLANILGTATGFLPAAKSGVDVYQVATGKPSMQNLGDSKFQGVNQGVGSETMNLGSNLLNSATQANAATMQSNSQARDSLDRFNQTWSSILSFI